MSLNLIDYIIVRVTTWEVALEIWFSEATVKEQRITENEQVLFKIVYDNSKKNEVKLDIGEVGLLAEFNQKNGSFFAYYVYTFGEMFWP